MKLRIKHVFIVMFTLLVIANDVLFHSITGERVILNPPNLWPITVAIGDTTLLAFVVYYAVDWLDDHWDDKIT